MRKASQWKPVRSLRRCERPPDILRSQPGAHVGIAADGFGIVEINKAEPGRLDVDEKHCHSESQANQPLHAPEPLVFIELRLRYSFPARHVHIIQAAAFKRIKARIRKK